VKISNINFTAHNGTRILKMRGPAEVEAVVEQLDQFGFAVVSLQLPPDKPPLEAVAAWLGLGEPYVPVLYRDDAASSVYADIKPRVGDDHPGFATANAQPIHVDGLLDPLGAIRTSLLYCVQPAAEGGRTIMFSSVAVFTCLAEADPAAAEVLLHDEVLERFPTLPGSRLEGVRGPAFAFDADGQLMTRFSDGPTEQWHPPRGREEDLDRALLFFRNAAEQPRFALPVMLGAGECLILRNDRLSHARESFVSEPGRPRHLVRGLYTKVPRPYPATEGSGR
jgi:hypothetical protein